jgi:hypothetical protein
MPFPLAHPAAVLPLRRYCPRYLNFPALVIGSLSPDFAYAFGSLHLGWFSHRLLAGSFGFCLPTGLVVVSVLYLARAPAVDLLPSRCGELFGPRGWKPRGSWLAFPVSVLIGAWTHIVLDSVFHQHGWLVKHLPALQKSIFWFGARRLPTWQLLYGTFSFVGAAWVAGAYLAWREQATGSRTRRPALRGSCALLFGAATLGLATDRSNINLVLLGILTTILVLGFLAATAWLFTAKQG